MSVIWFCYRSNQVPKVAHLPSLRHSCRNDLAKQCWERQMVNRFQNCLSFIFFNSLIFICLVLAVLGFCCCSQTFSSCGEGDYTLLGCTGSGALRVQWLSHMGLVGPFPEACGMFPDQVSNQCPLHCKVAS